MNSLPITYPSDGMFGRLSWRGLLLLTVTILAALSIWYALHATVPEQEITQTQMFDLIKAGHVTYLTNQPDAGTGIRYLTGTCNVPAGQSAEIPAHFKVPVDLQLDPYLLSEIKKAGYNGPIETVNNTNIALPLFLNFAPALLFLIMITYLVFRIFRFLTQVLNR